MNITPINNIKYHNFAKYNTLNKTKLALDSNQTSKPLKSMPVESLKAYYLNFRANTNVFQYNPISNIKPIYSCFDSDYSDIKEFSKFYSKKINSQLLRISRQDVKELASRVTNRTNAPKELVIEVLQLLSEYSNYGSLNKIQKIIDDYNIKNLGYDTDFTGSFNPNCHSNSVLNYLASKKRQLDISTKGSGKKYGFILDDSTLNHLEFCKNSDDRMDKASYRRFKSDVARKKVIFLNLPGWDVKCSDGKYRSANFLLGSGYLEDVAVDVVKRVQKGEKLDDILYSDFSQRLKDLLDNQNIDVEKIQRSHSHSSLFTIYKNLKTKGVTSDVVASNISKYFDGVEKEKIGEYLKYCDESTFVFSADSYAKSLIELHKKLQTELNKTGDSLDDVIYSVPYSYKSFVYSSYVYSKLNNIPSDNLTGFMRYRNWHADSYRKHPKVVLDDISASGDTQHSICSEIENATLDNNIISACILTSTTARRINGNYRTISVFNFDDYRYRTHGTSDEIEEKDAKNHLGDTGYMTISSCAAFPYMIPDSNNDFASDIFSRLLHKNNASSNKGLVLEEKKTIFQKLFGL